MIASVFKENLYFTQNGVNGTLLGPRIQKYKKFTFVHYIFPNIYVMPIGSKFFQIFFP